MALAHSEMEETDMRRVQLKTSLKRVEESELKDAEREKKTSKEKCLFKPITLIICMSKLSD